jgi:hypothetical protein
VDDLLHITPARVVDKLIAAASAPRLAAAPAKAETDCRRLVRPSNEVRRLLVDLPVLLLDNDDDRVRFWLGGNVIPPVIRLEEGHELETLSSILIRGLMRMGVPLIFQFSGWRAVTRFSGLILEVAVRP